MHKSKLILGVILAAAVGGCQDLAVENQNAPDRERATQQPVSAESFVASSFRSFWPVSGHDRYPTWAFSTMAQEMTSGFADFGQLELSAIPRTAWNNSPVNARNDVSEEPWYGFYRTISTVNDALIAIDSGLTIESASRTARTRAVGKFMQGVSHGYLAMYFDSAVVVDEKLALDTITVPRFQASPAVAAEAIRQLDSAIAIATRSPFAIPADPWFYTAMTSQEFSRLANSYAARIMVYRARTRAQRAAVDWAEVIRRIDAGIQKDFAPVAQALILEDDWKWLISRIRTGPVSDFGRPSNWALGPADSTNNYINWLNTPLTSRAAFRITTKDRRIHPAGAPTLPGKYVGYSANNIGAAARGTWRYSHYYFHRFGLGTLGETGPQVAVTMTEMDLLKAEALIRLNRAAEAVPLINKSRVAQGQLDPVTTDGPPDVPGCVPRKISGACGSLWDALRYEKIIEGLGVSGVTAFFDARGWQTLPEHTILELPIPGRELRVVGREIYTYGGPGGQSSAPAPDPERCPVALPRCP